jgi:Domain of unknown function (DUF222)
MSEHLIKIEYMSVATLSEPMERLEARICELAGHLTAATCQFLLLVADFDARKGWADWEMPSCAAWLSWKCQIASGTAREQVRVARSLAALPAITAEFAAGRLSYAKVRALTRIATPETEPDLLEMATPMTANQMERFAQAHRRVTEAGSGQQRPSRQLTWNRVKDLDYVFRAILPAEGAAVVLQALRAARNDLEHPHDRQDDVSAETRIEELSREDAANGVSFSSDEPPESRMESAENLADALIQVCADYLNAKAATADNPDTYQVIIHAGAQAISGELATEDVSAETPDGAADTLPVSHPAHPMRCHIQDGLAVSLSTLALISCNATISTMIHDTAGAILDVGRRTRKPPPAPPGHPGTRRLPLPVSRLPFPPDGRSPHRPLGKRRRDQARQPHQPVQETPQPGPRQGLLHNQRTERLRLLQPPRHRNASLPEATRRSRRYRRHPRRRHHPCHHHPSQLWRPPRPQSRHLDLLHQRPGQGRTPGSRTGHRRGVIVSCLSCFAGRLPGPGIRAPVVRSLLPG